MAITTRDQRASVLRYPFPVPDNQPLNQGDRQQVTWNFRGIEAQAPALPAFGFYRPIFRPRRRS